MTPPETSFDTHLDDLLHDLANPDLPTGFESRWHHRLTTQKETAMPITASQPPTARDTLWPSPAFATAAALRPRRTARSFWGATLAHAFALLLIVLLVSHHPIALPHRMQTEIALEAPVPHLPPRLSTIGGGGGQHSPAPVSRGNPPKFAPQQLLPPKTPPRFEPKLAVEPTTNVQTDLHMAKSDLPNIGALNSPLVGSSMGNGTGSGLGSGNGDGMGPGTGGNAGGGIETIGGGVSAPIVLYQVEPEFSDEARHAKAAGNVLVTLIVDEKGRPTHVRVLRGIGLGLDERAVAAVEQYRFKPALKDGKPVRVGMNIDVNFHIY